MQVVFVGIDPERDSQEDLARFVVRFNKNIKAVTGDNRSLAELAHFFRADFNRRVNYQGQLLNIPAGFNLPDQTTTPGSPQTENADGGLAVDGYQVNHSNRIFLLNPQAEYLGSFSSPQDAEKIIADLQMIIKR